VEFKPYIPAEKRIAEMTFTSIGLGALLAIVFGAANAYLGLKVGMTVSASIPASVISMGILKGILRRGTVLENNIVQNLASAAEALAAGVIFTIPAFMIWSREIGGIDAPSILKMFIMSVLGGIMGVLFMIPLRRYLIVQEHGKLPYPEGTACAEVLIAGDKGGTQAKVVFSGIGVGAIYKFLMGGLGLWKETPEWNLDKIIPSLRNGVIGFDILPALLGVGFIIGLQVSALMLAGGLLGWLVFIPLISYLGSHIQQPIYPAKMLIKDMNCWDIWKNYIRYIGAGGVVFGGIVSLTRSFPVIISSFKLGIREIVKVFTGEKEIKERTAQDISMVWVIVGSLIIAIILAILPNINLKILGALLTVIFGFFFATVSSRIVGIVGSSSNPVSGMTIATLLATTIILKAVGWQGVSGMITALTVGGIVCIAIAIAGDVSQDLKTGYIVGATPKMVQIAQILGVLISCLFVGWVVLLLDKTYTLGSQALPAPQANLMAIVIKGVMEANLPWILVIIGVFTAAAVEMLGAPALPFAVGLYLPVNLSTPVMVGGIISWLVTRGKINEQEKKRRLDKGVLIASGLIAGDALLGIILAVLKSRNIDFSTLIGSSWCGAEGLQNLVAIMCFILLGIYMFLYIKKRDNSLKDKE